MELLRTLDTLVHTPISRLSEQYQLKTGRTNFHLAKYFALSGAAGTALLGVHSIAQGYPFLFPLFGMLSWNEVRNVRSANQLEELELEAIAQGCKNIIVEQQREEGRQSRLYELLIATAAYVVPALIGVTDDSRVGMVSLGATISFGCSSIANYFYDTPTRPQQRLRHLVPSEATIQRSDPE